MTILKDILLKYRDKNWDFKILSKRKELENDIIEEFIDKDWDFDYLTDTLPLEFIEKYIDKPWNFYSLSKRVSLDFVEKYINKKWDFNLLLNLNDKKDNFIEKHIDKNWDFNKLKVENISLKLIDKNIDKPWDFKKLSKHPDLYLLFIEKHIDKEWDFNTIFINKVADISFVEKYQYKEWNYQYILFTERYVDNIKQYKFLIKYIDWENIYTNINLTKEFIEEFHESINFSKLSRITFRETNNMIVEKNKHFQKINNEFNQKLYLEPGKSNIPIFKKGGKYYWDKYIINI